MWRRRRLPRPSCFPALPQLEQRLQKLLHGLARLGGSGWIAADMRIELDASVVVGERRFRIGVHQHAAVAFADLAVAHRLRTRGHGDGTDAEQPTVKTMRAVGVFG